jgi:hypothetical protein
MVELPIVEFVKIMRILSCEIRSKLGPRNEILIMAGSSGDITTAENINRRD